MASLHLQVLRKTMRELKLLSPRKHENDKKISCLEVIRKGYHLSMKGTSYVNNRRTVSYVIVPSVLTSGRENSQSSLLPKSVLSVFA
ncbi:uncharacterized protein LOC141880546 isoform X2 [Acropora palmata]|uniref:uncharacterized protein LOC141880546 isoform X2 n=1 Tax=Acropora palmata TaxID=6131 RepID=UPI003DA18A5E